MNTDETGSGSKHSYKRNRHRRKKRIDSPWPGQQSLPEREPPPTTHRDQTRDTQDRLESPPVTWRSQPSTTPLSSPVSNRTTILYNELENLLMRLENRTPGRNALRVVEDRLGIRAVQGAIRAATQEYRETTDHPESQEGQEQEYALLVITHLIRQGW